MTLDLVYRDATRARRKLVTRALVVRAFRAAAPSLGLPRGRTVELGVAVVGPARIRALNRRYRKIDTPTDVLSFPLRTPEMAGYTAVSLGDLIICPSVIRAKAKLHGTTDGQQARWTVVHGLLHLAGYDHESGVTAARRMARTEQAVLERI